MPDLTAKRTLVKSPPELWEELSEVERLAKHLGAFGEITITKLEPEHTVAWEGEHASGTVSIEPSGWGTKVTLRAELPEPEPVAEAAPEPEPVAEPEPEPEPVPTPAPEPEPAPEPAAAEEAQHIAGPSDPFRVEPETEPDEEVGEETVEEAPRRGFLGWLFRRRTGPVTPAPEPIVPEPEPVAAEPEPVAAEPEPEPIVEPPAEPEPEPEPEPIVAVAEPVAADAEPGMAEPEPLEAEDAPEPAVEDPALDPERARVILDEALDTLGAAHHRPFSRG